MRTTIHDVARRAGVSISTVSRVLNGTSPVKADKRRLVLDAAEALGYVPNPAARSLLSKRTGGLGVLLPFVTGEFFSELLNGLDEEAQALGYFLTISTSHSRPEEFHKAFQSLDKRVDGLVVMAPDLGDGGARALLRPDTPVVFLNTDMPGLEADVINVDNYGGGRLLTQHLIEQGHRRIALVQGPMTTWDARERARGYRSAMAEAGLPTDGLEVEGGFSREDGYAATEALLERSPRPTAIVGANDYAAFGALTALRDAGLAVPDDVAVCGFDGLPSSRYAAPPLTTAAVPIREIGKRAVRLLVGRLTGEAEADPFRRDVVEVELTARGSTARAVTS